MGIFDAAASLFTNQNKAQTKPVPATQKKVLVVEDEKSLANSIEATLTREGYRIVYAENGQMGLEKALSEKPDVIILDLIMPVMDGRAMLLQLRKQPGFATVPVIVLTNAGTVDNMTDTRLYGGACEFLIKSNVSLDEIVQKVKQYTSV